MDTPFQNDKVVLGARTFAARCGLCALLIAPLAASAGQGGNSPVMLRMKFKPGDVNRYRMTMQMNMTMHMPNQPQPMTVPVNMMMTMEQKVDSVDAKGNGTVVTTIQNQQVTANGQTAPSPQVPPVTMRLSPQGKILSTQGMPANQVTNMMGNPFGSGGANGLTVLLPAKPVKPGDSWTQPVRLPGSALSGTTKNTLIRYENVGQFRTARIHTVANLTLKMMMDGQGQPAKTASKAASIIQGNIKIAGDNNFAVAEGKLVRMAMNGDAAMKMQQKKAAGAKAGTARPPQNMTMNMKMTAAMDLLE
ncbi:MAG TPA: hypothetical protein VFB21_13830 [Chthonomonadaceae bacterium]|nr:hypothetical protein [Chthonomonadaceae bacterium]